MKSEEVANLNKTVETLKASLSNAERKASEMTDAHKSEASKLQKQLSDLSDKEAAGVVESTRIIEEVRTSESLAF